MKHKYFPLIIVCITLLFEYSHAQTQSQNYVLSRTYRTKGGLVSGGDDKKYWGVPLQVQTQIAYVDGLGKPIQSVLVSGNPLQMDLTAVTGYNNMFQVSKNYLPVALATADGNFHETVSGDYYNDDNKVGSKTGSYWTETLYDKSPLGRVMEGKSPGVATGVRKKYLVYQERTHRAVKRYYFKADGSLETSAVYADNTLNVTETKDENDKKVEEFTDQNGRAILKRVAGDEYTYYVYNGKGQLRYVLQPEYQNYANLDSYAFQYTYDGKGRMVTKKIPGQGSFSMEYYDNDMLKYLVDAKSQRYYYKYDALNRQTEMGIVDGAAEKALLKTKYDDYAGMSENFDNSVFNLTEDDHFIGTPKTDSKKGLVTMISARVLNGGENWLNTVMFYDKKGRLVQTHRGLYELGGQSKEVVSYKLDFVGNILEERTEQFTNAMQYRFDKVFVYDHQNRLRSVKHTLSEVVNNVATVKKSYEHVANRYNEIGLLETEFLHKAVSATDYTQKLKYKYTPRGWLYAIDNNGGTTYQIGLQYNENGNINNFSWQTSGPRSSFSTINYDGSNRLTEASGGTLKESNITYDKNGNILTLKREGAVTDNLTYKYPGKTNRLEGIGNTGANGQGVKNGDSSYGYDSNGNMTSDGNKGAAIAYNFLNLPAQVVLSNPARTINYVYDGAGNKLKMEAVGGTTFYAGAFEYKTDKTLLRIGLEEGQLIKTNNGGYDVNYYLRDHLGNVRMVLKEDGSVLQETEYYAFGLPVPKTGNDAVNKYLYNGKEKQPETGWLDYGARTYMPEIGRWGSVDPMGENHFNQTPYNYVLNNPTNLIDPFGLDTSLYALNSGKLLDIKESGSTKTPIWVVDETAENYNAENPWATAMALTYEIKKITGNSFRDNHPLYKKGTMGGNQVYQEDLLDVGNEFLDLVKSGLSDFEGKDMSLRTFRGLVTDNGKWDLKSGITSDKTPSFGAIAIGEWSLLRGRLRRYDDYGNISYGIFGISAGFSRTNLLIGSGINQFVKNVLGGTSGVGDESRDRYMITSGFNLSNWSWLKK